MSLTHRTRPAPTRLTHDAIIRMRPAQLQALGVVEREVPDAGGLEVTGPCGTFVVADRGHDHALLTDTDDEAARGGYDEMRRLAIMGAVGQEEEDV